MQALLPRLGVALYCVALIAFVLWQGLRGLPRLHAVVEYLEFRETRYPESRAWKAPLAREATMPAGAVAVLIAGVLLIPLMLAVSVGSVGPVPVVVGVAGVLAAAAVIAVTKRSPWAETRAILWEAASAEGRHSELLEEALRADPQVREAAGS